MGHFVYILQSEGIVRASTPLSLEDDIRT